MERYDEYRDSGVEWIGEIPAGWELKRLKYLGSTRSGMGNKKPEDFGTGRPFLSYKDVYSRESFLDATGLVESTEDDCEKFSVRRGDAFFTGSSETIEELGFSSVCISTIPQATFNGFTIRFRPNGGELYPEFSKYLFRSEVFRGYLRQRDNSITRANLSQQILGNAIVVLPSLRKQVTIASYLDRETTRVDSLIADCEREVELLQEYRKAVISEAVTKGLDPNVPMKDSGIEWIGAIPVSWETARLDKIAVRKSGHTPDKKVPEYWDGDIVWVSLADSPALRTNKYISTSTTMTTREGIAHSSAEVLPAGSVLLSRDASVGLTAIAGVPLAVSQHFMAYICGDNLSNEYLRYVFLAMRQEFERLSMGSTIPTIGLPLVKQFVIPYPLRKVQDAIVAYLDEKTAEIDALIADYQSMADKLREYRKSLISEAVTGKFKVPGV